MGDAYSGGPNAYRVACSTDTTSRLTPRLPTPQAVGANAKRTDETTARAMAGEETR